MAAFRLFLRDCQHLALLLVAIALAMKALMPAGMMLGHAPGTKVLTVLVCADAQGGAYAKQIVVPHTGKSQSGEESGKKSQSCPWSALGMATLSGADAVLLALAFAFILTLGLRDARPPQRRREYLRPPLRGPPATA